MLYDELDLIADAITKKGIALKFKYNSTLSFLQSTGNNAESTRLVASKLADKINANINYIYNRLLPVQRAAVKYVEEIYSKYKPEYEHSNWVINEIGVDDFVHHLAAKVKQPHNINEMCKIPAEILDLNITYPELVGQYLTYGTGTEASMLSALIARLGEEKIVKIWNDDLCTFSLDNPYTLNMLNDPLEYGEELAILYVIYSNFRNNKPSFVKTENFNQYVDTCLHLIERAFTLYCGQIDGYKASGRLILNVKDTTINVFKPTYEEYLREGGTPDAILALGIKNSKDLRVTTLNEIKANVASLKEEWANYVAISKHKLGLREGELYRNAYSILIDNMFKEIIPADLVAENENTCNMKVASYAFDEVIKECSTDTKMISNVEKVVGKILSKVFGETDLGFFIRTIKHYGEKYEIEPKEAAGLAIIDYVTVYTFNQIDD